MKLTYQWLNEHIRLDKKPNEISDDLTSLGLEVEKVTSANNYLKNFYICEVLEVYKHPNADRLKVCEITTGKEKYKVVCGANNAIKGLKSVFAPIGSFIPGKNFHIERKNIRGIEGDGMLCSEEELGLPTTQDGIIELDNKYSVGKNLSNYIKEDFFFQIGLTPNRGDCASVRGIARDLSAKLKIKLNNIKINTKEGDFKSKIVWDLSNLKDKKSCPLIYGRHFRISKNKESPLWLRKKLISIGLKPISSLVDITNYILFDIGRPLHVFDIKKIKGNLRLITLRNEESFTGLDKKKYLLKKGDLVIKDDEKTVSLAGIIGGINSCVDESTKDVFLEVAYFNPKTIATTGRRIGINSDARYRFERGVDPQGLIEGLELATKLINEVCEGTFSKCTVSGKRLINKKTIKYDHNFFDKIVGYKIPAEKQKEILTRLHFSVEKKENYFFINPPSWRHDIEASNDIVEEILRIDGYDKVPLKTIANKSDNKSVFSVEKNLEFNIREFLAKAGLYEAITFSFISEKKLIPGSLGWDILERLKLENPISVEMNIMRNSLYPNLLDITARNFARGIETTELYEIGYIFEGVETSDQKSKLAILLSGYENKKTWHHKRRYFDFFDMKSKILSLFSELEINDFDLVRSKNEWYHPGIAADLVVNNQIIASFGEVHPKLKKMFSMKQPTFLGEIHINIISKFIDFNKEKKPIKLSPFLTLKKDFAFLLPNDKSVQDLLEVIKATDKLIDKVNVFDLYKEEQEKHNVSVGIEVEFIQQNKVFNSEEINHLMEKIIKNVELSLGAKLRPN